MAAPIQQDHHYVSRLYLKRWASGPQDRVWTYRLLVPHEKVKEWKPCSTRGVAYRSHLYTRIVAGGESDQIERWLNREFETPADRPIEKAISGARLTRDDWSCLIRFLGSQDVRTPVRLSEHLKRAQMYMPGLLDRVLVEAVEHVKRAKAAGVPLIAKEDVNEAYLPLRLTPSIEPSQEVGTLKIETIIGRGSWLFSLRHTLTNTIKVLHKHRWTILIAPESVNWFTSDNPVVRLNFQSENKYDLGGGWNSPGTEIFLPLSSRHLLYTQVDRRVPSRGE